MLLFLMTTDIIHFINNINFHIASDFNFRSENLFPPYSSFSSYLLSLHSTQCKYSNSYKWQFKPMHTLYSNS